MSYSSIIFNNLSFKNISNFFDLLKAALDFWYNSTKSYFGRKMLIAKIRLKFFLGLNPENIEYFRKLQIWNETNIFDNK